MPWYAIRTVYQFGLKSDGKNVFEERIVCFEASDWAEAHAKAWEEADHYAKMHDFAVHSQQEAYEQDGDALIDGYEIWSQLFESKQSLNQFYDNRYKRYKYSPEEQYFSEKARD